MIAESWVDYWVKVAFLVMLTVASLGGIGFIIVCIRHWREFWELPDDYSQEDNR